MAPFDLIRSIIEDRPRMIGRRMILHAGTPKTGTTSMQFFLDGQRQALRRQGILYPQEGLARMRVPKHQWLHHFIHPKLNEEQFARYLAGALDEADSNTSTIILSTEAIFNHWWDYSAAARDVFLLLGTYFDLACFVWLRDPVSFFKSYYLQCLKNPDDGRAYGRDLSAGEMLGMDWVGRHLRYGAFLRDAEQVFAAGRVYAFAYDGDTVARIARLLTLDASPASEPRNVSPTSGLSVSILRQVNGIALTAQQKSEVVRLVADIDSTIGERAPHFELDAQTIQQIREICPVTRADLAELDAVSTERWHSRWCKRSR